MRITRKAGLNTQQLKSELLIINRFAASEERDLTIESVSNPADPSTKMEAGNTIFHLI